MCCDYIKSKKLYPLTCFTTHLHQQLSLFKLDASCDKNSKKFIPVTNQNALFSRQLGD